MRELLAQHGDSMAAWESRVFREPWSAAPVRVDVTAYSNWAGAYTTSGPSHITVSSTSAGNQNDQGLEILFHEVLHTMDDSLRSSLVVAFRANGKAPPRDLTHTFIFYTAGALAKRAMPEHVTYGEKTHCGVVFPTSAARCRCSSASGSPTWTAALLSRRRSGSTRPSTERTGQRLSRSLTRSLRRMAVRGRVRGAPPRGGEIRGRLSSVQGAGATLAVTGSGSRVS